MEDKSVEANITKIEFFKYYVENNLFPYKSNITGLEMYRSQNNINNIKENNKNSNLIELSPICKKSTKYSLLSGKGKINYIKKLIDDYSDNHPYDSLAVKRKKYTLGHLIRQFDLGERAKNFKENDLCKIPYPLLHVISNRKLGNHSSNLMVNILSLKGKKLSKKEENEIKNSKYSKIFNSTFSELVKKNVKNKSNLNQNANIIKNNKSILRNNLINSSSNGNFPFINKYIKNKYIKDKQISNKSQFFKSQTSINFYIKNTKRSKSNYSLYIDNLSGKYFNNMYRNSLKSKLTNKVETFKNKTVCLINHKNNMKNNSFINERLNKMLDEYFSIKRKVKYDPKINELIRDVSHLKFNNQIMSLNRDNNL
jgi:hypothetical protein